MASDRGPDARKLFPIRVSADELATLRAASQKAEMPVGTFIKDVALRAARRLIRQHSGTTLVPATKRGRKTQ
jgi:hypothetical protein